MNELLQAYSLLDSTQSQIFNSTWYSDFQKTGFLEILRINEYGNPEKVHFGVMTMDGTSQFFGGGIINGDGIMNGNTNMCFSAETIYKLISDRNEYNTLGPIKHFIGSIRVNNKTVYLAVFEKYPSNVFSLNYDFIDIENINRYHCFDSIGKHVSIDLTKLYLSDLHIIGIDALNRANPFTKADDNPTGDFLFMMSYSMSKNVATSVFFVFSANIQRVKSACLCKGSEAGWNNFLEKFSKEFTTSFFDTLFSDKDRRLWRSNKVFKMHVETFQELL